MEGRRTRLGASPMGLAQWHVNVPQKKLKNKKNNPYLYYQTKISILLFIYILYYI